MNIVGVVGNRVGAFVSSNHKSFLLGMGDLCV